MKLVNADMFLYAESIEADAIVIPTNGFVKNNGALVMGAGVAKLAADYWENLPGEFGRIISGNGHIVQFLEEMTLGSHTLAVVSFPTKPRRGSNLMPKFADASIPAPGWMCYASPNLIAVSCDQLIKVADNEGWEKIVMPIPGIGNGGLDWKETAYPILRDKLDDRFFVTSPKMSLADMSDHEMYSRERAEQLAKDEKAKEVANAQDVQYPQKETGATSFEDGVGVGRFQSRDDDDEVI